MEETIDITIDIERGIQTDRVWIKKMRLVVIFNFHKKVDVMRGLERINNVDENNSNALNISDCLFSRLI